MFRALQEVTFKYPSSKTGIPEDRDIFVLDVSEDSILGFSIKDLPNREEFLNAVRIINEAIDSNPNNYRRFKLNKIVQKEELNGKKVQ